MSNRIDEIMQLSDNGYIEDYDDIEVILEHFLNYTMEELNNALPKNYKILDFAVDVAVKLGNIDIADSSQLEKNKAVGFAQHYKVFRENSLRIGGSYLELHEVFTEQHCLP